MTRRWKFITYLGAGTSIVATGLGVGLGVGLHNVNVKHTAHIHMPGMDNVTTKTWTGNLSYEKLFKDMPYLAIYVEDGKWVSSINASVPKITWMIKFNESEVLTKDKNVIAQDGDYYFSIIMPNF